MANDELVAVIERTLAEVFPVVAGVASVEIVATNGRLTAVDRWGNLRVTLRLIYWNGPNGTPDRSIDNICEQEIVLAQEDMEGDITRYQAFVRGWALALGHYLVDMPGDWFVMPADLFFPRVLRLKRPRTVNDFERALMAPSRLGRFLDRGD